MVVTARRLAADLLWKHGTKAADPVHALLQLSQQVFSDYNVAMHWRYSLNCCGSFRVCAIA